MAARIHLRRTRFPICRHCKNMILSGPSCRVRIRNSKLRHISLTCGSCGKQTRIPLTNRRV